MSFPDYKIYSLNIYIFLTFEVQTLSGIQWKLHDDWLELSTVDSSFYWVFGLCPSSGFFLNNNEKHNVSETGSVSVLR
jgi:hypothetical protein